MNDIASHLASLGFVQSTPGVWTGTVPDGCPVHATIHLHATKGIAISYTRHHLKPVKSVSFRSPCKTLAEVKMALNLANARWVSESTVSPDTLQRDHIRRLACHI